MNITSTKNLVCQKCNNAFDQLIFHNINVTNDPEFKKMIFNDTFFYFECPHCKNNFYLLYPILYHDMIQKYMLYFLPPTYHINEESFNEKFSDITDINKRIVRTLDDLKEKILIFDLGLSDFAINLLKILILEKNYIPITSSFGLYLNSIEKDNFNFLLTQNNTIEKINVPIEEYKIAIDIAGKDMCVNKNIFSMVNIDSAEKFLNNYKTLRIS